MHVSVRVRQVQIDSSQVSMASEESLTQDSLLVSSISPVFIRDRSNFFKGIRQYWNDLKRLKTSSSSFTCLCVALGEHEKKEEV